MGQIEIMRLECLVGEWVEDVECQMVEEEEREEVVQEAWDDVHEGHNLDPEKVKEGRREELAFMDKRGIWTVKPTSECWEVTGTGPVSVRGVDTDKNWIPEGEWDPLVRCRLVARDCKGGDKYRDDLFAETPPLECQRMILSRAATRRTDGRYRKVMFVDARKAHLNPKCEDDVYIELPEECGLGKEWCGKLNYWLYGFRPAAAAWEKHYSGLLEGIGFERGNACGVIFYHEGRDISLAVHGDDFTFCGLEEDLRWVRDLMAGWFDIKVRATIGEDADDDKEVTI